MLTPNPSLEALLPGTQLTVRRRGYWHHGIYVGHGRVIHYAGWFHSAQGLIEEVSLEQFTQGRDYVIGRCPPDRRRGEDIVRRARSRLGEQAYDLLRNNCEHLCNWCYLGQARSEQIEALTPAEVLFWGALQKLRTYLGSREPSRGSEVSLA